MSAYAPQATKTGNLPHLSCILCKPEPLGTEFKVVADSVTGMLLYLEIQEGKQQMAKAKYADEKKASTACCLRLSEETTRTTNVTVDDCADDDDPIPKLSG